MEPWTLSRYRRPFLEVEGVEISPTSHRVILQTRGGHREIQCEDDYVARALAEGLIGLRDPADPRWAQVRGGADSDGWTSLLEHVDHWSLIRDSAASPGVAAAAAERRIEDSVAEAVASVHERVAVDCRADLRAIAVSVLSDMDGRDTSSPWVDPNFYRGLLRLMARAALASAPATWYALRRTLLRVAGEDADTEAAGGPDLAIGLYGIEDLRSKLTAATEFLAASIAPDAARRWMPSRTQSSTICGSDFAALAERALREGLAHVGGDRFLGSLTAVTSSSPLVIGCYVEEYHVTRRFVEMITPLMAKALSPQLRALVFRYYEEEVGHEAFERATCESLGVDVERLDQSYPLPLHTAYVDVFTYLAGVDPLGFFTSVTITEGILGEPSPLPDLLSAAAEDRAEFRAVFREHEALNQKLYHAAISRLALQEIAAISPASQVRALESMAFLLELNTRAWDGVAAFYGPLSEFRHHGWLSQPMPAALGDS